MSCYNSLIHLAHIARTQRNVRQPEIKTRLLQFLYANPFAGLDHEDPYTHLTKFYETFGTRSLRDG